MGIAVTHRRVSGRNRLCMRFTRGSKKLHGLIHCGLRLASMLAPVQDTASTTETANELRSVF